MLLKPYDVNLDIYDTEIKSTKIVFYKDDTDVYTLNISLLKKGIPFNLSEVGQVKITFKKQDKNIVVGTCNIEDIENGVVTYDLKTQEISYPGLVTVELTLYGLSGERLTANSFVITVKDDLDDDDWVESTTEYPILTSLISDVADIKMYESTRQSNEITRQSNESTRQQQESERQDSIIDIENRFNLLETSQQQESEVINARTSTALDKTFDNLNSRLENTEEEVFNPAYLTEEFTSSIHSLPSTVANGQLNVESIQGNTIYSYADNGLDYINWNVSGGVTKGSGGIHLIDSADGTARATSSFPNLIKGQQYTALFYVKTSSDTAKSVTVHRDGVEGTTFLGFPAKIGIQKMLFTARTDEDATFLQCYLHQWAVGSIVDFEFYGVLEGDRTNDDSINQQFQFGANSTISAQKYTSVGKNLFDGELEVGAISSATGANVVAPNDLRSKNYIRVNGSINNKISLDGVAKPMAIRLYDFNKNFIGIDVISSSVTSINSNVAYIRFYYNSSNLNDKIQVEEGTIATPYEPYKESNMYVKATDSEGNILPMRSLPNDVKDEINEDGGQWKFEQNVSDDYVLQESDVVGMYKGYTNIDIVWVNYKSDMLVNSYLDKVIYGYEGKELNTDTGVPYDDSFYVGYFYQNGTNINILVPKGEYIDLTAAQTDLVTNKKLTLNYQLLQPVITPATVVGHLDSCPNGTIIVDVGIVHDYDFYDEVNGIQIVDINNPIGELDKVLWTDRETGAEVNITDTCTVAVDGLSFISTYAIEDDLIWYAFKTTEDSTIPTVKVTAPLNSKAVLEDLVKVKGELQDDVENLDLRVKALMQIIEDLQTKVEALEQE